MSTMRLIFFTLCSHVFVILSSNLAQAATHIAKVEKAADVPMVRLACNQEKSHPHCQLRIYEIMVEAFVDGDANANHNFGYGTSHHRGDLQGIIQSLDYIKSTGSNAVWLTPIFYSIPEALQNNNEKRLDATGYFASDYFQIDPRFGTLEQAKNLVDEAHKRGLFVLFDGVLGHHKYNIKASPSGLLPAGNYSEVDYSEANTLAFYQEVVTYWIKTLKIDGWRFDQVYQVPIEDWRSIKKSVETASNTVSYKNNKGKMVHPLAYMVAEVLDNENKITRTAYGNKNTAPVLSSAFDFPMRTRLVQTLASDETGMSHDKNNLPATTLAEGFATHATYPEHAMPNLILGNHDLVRFGDLIQRSGLSDSTETSYWQRHQLAFTFMAAYSGPITLYYGEEIGQEVPNYVRRVDEDCVIRGLCEDHVARDSGIVEGVTLAQLNPKQKALKNYVAELWQLRDRYPALAIGARTHLYADNAVYIDRKDAGAQHILVVLNTKTNPAQITLPAALMHQSKTLNGLIYPTTLKPDASGNYTIKLAPLSGQYFLGK